MDIDTKYIKLLGLTLLLALLIYIAILIVFVIVPVDFPLFYHVTVSLFGAGYLVYRFFADHVA